MANMFSGNTTKSVPKTFDECIRIDAVSENLWTWSERLERWGKILFIILIIVGIIATIAAGVEANDFLEEVGYIDRIELAEVGVEVPSVFDVVITSLLQWGLYAFLEYCAYHVLALLIGALASITQNTIITANVALLKVSGCSATFETAPQTNTAPKSTINTLPPRNYSRPTPPPPGMWICQNCGTHNSLNYGQCKKCGKFKS